MEKRKITVRQYEAEGVDSPTVAVLEHYDDDRLCIWFENKPDTKKQVQFIQKLSIQVKPSTIIVSFVEVNDKDFNPLEVFTPKWALDLINKSGANSLLLCLEQTVIDKQKDPLSRLTSEIKTAHPDLDFKIFNMVVKAETYFKAASKPMAI